MRLRSLLLLLLLGAMVPLTAMAYASPPDPVWVNGYFDDGDYDNVVVLITSSGATVDPFPLDSLQPFSMILTCLAPLDESRAPACPASPADARAPPAA